MLEENIVFLALPDETYENNTIHTICFLWEETAFVFGYFTSGMLTGGANLFNVCVIEYYDDEMGLESSYNPISYDGGDYTVYVKPNTQTYTVEIPYISLEAPSVQLNISAYYSPGFSAMRKSIFPNAQDYYGKDIKLNIEQYIFKQGDEYKYIDAAGAILGFGQYAVDTALNGKSMTIEGALIATGLGVLGGVISGYGARHFYSIKGTLFPNEGVAKSILSFNYAPKSNLFGNSFINRMFADNILHAYKITIMKNTAFSLGPVLLNEIIKR